MADRKIAPHQGKELELILKGKKPIASLDMKKDERQYRKVLESGQVLSIIHTAPDEIAFCLPENTHKLFEYWELLNEEVISDVRDYQRRMGRLFGYSEEEIEAFVNGDIKCNCSHCRGVSRDD